VLFPTPETNIRVKTGKLRKNEVLKGNDVKGIYDRPVREGKLSL
jgi:hypothetical protein